MIEVPATAELIQRRMSEIRHDLEETVGDISDQARRLQDWRYYVREYPWVIAGAAAALGYLIVPTRNRVIRLDPKELTAVGQQEKKVVVESRPGTAQLLLRTALSHLSNVAVRSAAVYFGHKFGVLGGSARE